MPATYEPLATTTLGSNTTSITFNSISSAYTDLRLVVFYNIVSGNIIRVRFNSDSGSNYSVTYLSGNSGSVRECQSQLNLTYVDASWNATTSSTTIFAMSSFDIFSYSASVNKTVLVQTANSFSSGTSSVETCVGLWRNTSTINSIEIAAVNSPGQQLRAGTVATLYGILRA